ncbi:hypothetical protein TMatcc_009473 [Talaromyces marneffei ATCC 18224]|uniref:Integral membrane protein n=2 Tax=Talaromyces marneffei TaxID=37727 RepID=B6QSC9_TALMQ|nr:uncharacterized protein EYB26_008718 [Talaromyces marneffei]EEA19337.1 integral membrane protein [Talaromyces marneffei ATCC 18224]KAE8547663.1 hypothetical protein EYB25_009456 [Talaromyces marneffei]QGA21008.1 hypothetical protein EYB26_008718 [Talaromyces marneffei]
MGWVYNASPEVESTSNYPAIIAVCIVLTLLMTLTVSTRIAVRWRQHRTGLDDYIMAVAMVFSIIYATLCIVQTRYGLGLPITARPKQNLHTYTRVNFAGRPFYQFGIGLFKLALCVSYLRLLSGTSKKLYRIIIITIAAISTLGHFAWSLVLIFNCNPVSKSWTPSQAGTCLPFGPVNYGMAGFSIACDIITILLPIPMLLDLKVRPAQRAGIIALFSLGLFTTVCSILRMTQIRVIAYGNGNSTLLVLWGTIEFNVGNIITSVPYLAPLFRRWVSDFGYRIGYGSRSHTVRTTENYILKSYGKNSIKSSVNHDPTSTVSKRTVIRTPSEELILGVGDEPGPREIMRTTEYKVVVDEEKKIKDYSN